MKNCIFRLAVRPTKPGGGDLSLREQVKGRRSPILKIHQRSLKCQQQKKDDSAQPTSTSTS